MIFTVFVIFSTLLYTPQQVADRQQLSQDAADYKKFDDRLVNWKDLNKILINSSSAQLNLTDTYIVSDPIR